MLTSARYLAHADPQSRWSAKGRKHIWSMHPIEQFIPLNKSYERNWHIWVEINWSKDFGCWSPKFVSSRQQLIGAAASCFVQETKIICYPTSREVAGTFFEEKFQSEKTWRKKLSAKYFNINLTFEPMKLPQSLPPDHLLPNKQAYKWEVHGNCKVFVFKDFKEGSDLWTEVSIHPSIHPWNHHR